MKLVAATAVTYNLLATFTAATITDAQKQCISKPDCIRQPQACMQTCYNVPEAEWKEATACTDDCVALPKHDPSCFDKCELGMEKLMGATLEEFWNVIAEAQRESGQGVAAAQMQSSKDEESPQAQSGSSSSSSSVSSSAVALSASQSTAAVLALSVVVGLCALYEG